MHIHLQLFSTLINIQHFLYLHSGRPGLILNTKNNPQYVDDVLLAKEKVTINKWLKFENLLYPIVAISLLIRLICIGSNDLLVEEAYYWNYAQHIDFGYLDHPPMVAVLIKLSTSLLGTNEFAVRLPSIICWLIAAFFTFKLTNLLARGAGRYAVFLLAILPYFFLQSLVITPDQPLIVCWSAALYFLYRSLILNESKCWYIAGIWLGLGMLSKYTIALLGPATLLYMLIVPSARSWFIRKEPYYCLMIVTLLFTPVIYWNATHEWASFLFQSTRRFKFTYSFSLHELIALLIFFLMPLGTKGLCKLFTKKSHESIEIDLKTKRYIQIFALLPFAVFAVFSLNHGVKFNWIGPALLIIIPWLAVLIQRASDKDKRRITKGWLFTAVISLSCYCLMMVTITLGIPEIVQKNIFQKFISWRDLTHQFYLVAKQVEKETHSPPIFVPLDLYNISSELNFYQAKFLSHGDIQQTYPIVGRHVFGEDSLMYRYWAKNYPITGKTLILISTAPSYFDNPEILKQIRVIPPTKKLWSHGQGRGELLNPIYYRVVQASS